MIIPIVNQIVYELEFSNSEKFEWNNENKYLQKLLRSDKSPQLKQCKKSLSNIDLFTR